MRRSKEAAKWVLAAALMGSMPIGQALADPPVAPTVIDKPGHGVPVPRSFPDLVPYWNFDPPKSPLFDISKFTLSGDMRVRGEYRNNGFFGANASGAPGRSANDKTADAGVQQWARIGLNYSASQDVDFFTQLQYSKTWGGANTDARNANDAASQTGAVNGSVLGVRQAFIMIRNLGVDGLSLKAGRQLVVMGNHRLFGHFDWNNQAFSHDGITIQYNQPTYEVWGGWLHLSDQDSLASGASSGGIGQSANNTTPLQGGSNSADLLFTRLAFKPIAGLAIEPLWVFLNNKTGVATTGGVTPGVGNVLAPHAPGQNRHTLGGRVAYRQGMFDGTFEGYWQTGSMAVAGQANTLHINATALAVEGGITLQNVPTNPRVGLEFNYASGDGDGGACARGGNCNGNANTFENLYPTNHIVMGYADRMAWRNMLGFSGSLQLNPTQQSHLEARYWVFQKANNGDCWYTASQGCAVMPAASGVATSNSLYKELDLIYTLFFKGNKVAWQTGGAYLWSGGAIDQTVAGSASGNGPQSSVNSTWAYTQLQINF